MNPVNINLPPSRDNSPSVIRTKLRKMLQCYHSPSSWGLHLESVFAKSCCIDVNRSRTAAFGSERFVTAGVLHKGHAENAFRAAVVARNKTSHTFLGSE